MRTGGPRSKGRRPYLFAVTVTPTFDTGGKKAKLLFVDDEERILNALRTLFRSQYHVFTAENGALALEFAKRFGIHVVVSDQRMPGTTGVQFLKEVRERWPDSVRIIISGYTDSEDIVAGINEAGIHQYLRRIFLQQHTRNASDHFTSLPPLTR